MPTLNSKVDDYIAKSADFAKPILEHFRAIVHKASPDITESIKWGVPSFDYKGKMMCSVAAFKKHCAIGFWLGAQVKALKPYLEKATEAASEFGRIANITSVKDLPKDMDLIAAVKEAIHLADLGVTMKRAPAKKSAELPVPEALSKALQKNKKAKEVFENFSPSHRKEYIQWINDAKTDATRDKRLASAMEWIAEGKGRNWKYE
ncbi:YdeI/OmpD-associated family protein [Niabella ginsengisoli]|uniref:YdeI/OmpD-associated family protein n=1 Tax=Niabella ginsengisoli TaxID=522298 RepID=A0ABS9SE34_9BACT|nr:YdeI/OmpD-associated family protein [Niabella ginsengisoli]MCH5596618.1 YdeI/OmpD-associated family protein [Niabella ginsengisoli]